jgi:hypothetical protein
MCFGRTTKEYPRPSSNRNFCKWSNLETMVRFYPQNYRWLNCKNKVIVILRKISEGVNSTNNEGELETKRSELCNSGPCMHTEPICIFDHIDSHGRVPCGTPLSRAITMEPRFKPCSQNALKETRFDCEEMLAEVARLTERDIDFIYDR